MRLLRCTLLLWAAALLSLLSSPSLLRPVAALPPTAAFACGACEAIVDEVNAGIAATTITHQVQTRFRVDEKKKIPYARTEHNLLEIIEAKDFAKKFDQYAIVKPRSPAAASIKQAYGLAATAGATGELSQQQQQQQPQASSEETPAADASTAATTEADASGDAAAEPVVSAPAPPREFVAPAGQPLPQSLANHHVHLVHLDHTRGTALSVEHNSRVSSRIRAAVANFLEDNLDETVLLFHKDVPDIKTKLCVDVTEVCKPRDNKAAAAEKGGKKGKEAKKQQKKKHHDAAEAAVAAAAAAVTAAATPTPAEGAAADAHPLKEEL